MLDLRRVSTGGLAALLLLVAGCDEPSGPRAYTRTRVASRASAEVKPGASLEARFRMAAPAAGHAGGPAQPSAPAPPQQLPFAWEVPAGWTEQPPTSMRLVNLQAGHPEAECYLTFLGGAGGGLVANVNRWRQQMALPALPDEAIEALPRREVLGKPGVLVELEGAFSGMGGPVREGWAMVGVILAASNGTLFVKMTGPAEVVAEQRPRLEAFLESLRIRQDVIDEAGAPPSGDDAPPPASGGADSGAALPPGHPAVGPSAGASGEGELGFDLPSGWRRVPDPAGSMRALTFALDAAPEAECYVGALRGPVAGAEQTLASWRRQFGDAEPARAEVGDAVLGQPATWVELAGTYGDLRGGTHADWMLLGAIVAQGEETLFVKLVGPRVAIEGERERFASLCTSLRLP